MPSKARQDGEIPRRWPWVEPSVWTDRMLATLDNGVKGGKWFSLIDKVFSERNLAASWTKVHRNHGAAGVDHQSVERFARRESRYLAELARALRDDRYQPQPVQRHWIPKPGTKAMRPLGIPTVKDRVVQGALRHVLEPIFEASFVDRSFGFRPGRSCKDALRCVNALLKQGYTWVVDADIQSYFGNIQHDVLMREIEREVADGRVLDLIRRFLEQEVMEGMKTWKPEAGTPQGAVVSPLLANVYLHPVDEALCAAGLELVRYADDLVILCRTQREAEQALALLREQLANRGLTLHPDKTGLVDATQKGGFDFLGYHFERGMKWPRKKSLGALKDRIRAKTRRNSGRSLQQTIADINPTLRGWFGFFKHGHWTVFSDLDKWIRMRLRSILRRFQKRRGRAKGRDHQRWPNAHFADAGLFSLLDAWRAACQSR